MLKKGVGVFLSNVVAPRLSLIWLGNGACHGSCLVAAAHRACSGSSSYTYEVSKDPDEWKHVEALLPNKIVPPPPSEALTKFPTPSGWIPQQESKHSRLPYYVARTKNHMMPVYIKEYNKHPIKFTQVTKISGDLWALDAELREHLAELDPDNAPILTQVHEPGRFIKIRGDYTDQVAQYLLDKGF